jgi:probable addiction module antidote protein
LTAALDEGDSATFLLALRDVADARGMSTLAAKAQLNRENLYRMLSEHGNPQLDSLTALLDALDLRLEEGFVTSVAVLLGKPLIPS